MRLRSIELRNYRRFRHALVELGDGVTGILGRNGVGKSTLVEAVAWALFGNEPAIVRTTKDGVRSAAAGPNEECSVTIEFDLEADRYRLTRSLKGKDSKADASLLVNDLLVARTDKAVTEAVQSRLGMDHKSFFVSVFARQRELNALSTLRPAQRRELVLRMLGIGTLDDVIASISADQRSCREGVETMCANLRTAEGADRRLVLQDKLGSLKEEQGRLTMTIERAQDQLGPIGGEEAQAKTEMERAEGRSRTNSSLAARIATQAADIRTKRARIAKVDAELRNLEERRASLPALEQRVAGMAGLREERDRLEELRLRRQEYDSVVSALEQRSARLLEAGLELEAKRKELDAVGDMGATISSLEEALTANLSTLDETRERVAQNQSEERRCREEELRLSRRREGIVALGPESSCPTCDRRLDEQYQVLLSRLDEERADLRERADAARARGEESQKGVERLLKSRNALELRLKDARRSRERSTALVAAIETLGKAKRTIEEELSTLERRRSALGPVDFDPMELQRTRSRLEQLQRDENALTGLRTELSWTEGLQKERGQLRLELIESESAEESLRKEMVQLAFREDELREARDRYVRTRDQKESVLRSMQTAMAERSRIEGEERATQAHLEELERAHGLAEAKRAELHELSVLLEAMREFRANLVARVVPSISQMASELFVELTDGRYGGLRLDDEYEMHVLDQGQEYPLERFSGGESDLASLSLRLAISRMIEERSGHHVNLLVLDEIFGSQDQDRKRNVLELLNALQRQFGQILVITHIEDIKDTIGNSVVVEEGEDGYSRVRAS